MATSSPTRDFDGTGDWLATGDNSTYNITTGDITVIAWCLNDTTTGDATICGNANTSTNTGWALQYTRSGDPADLQFPKFGVGDTNSNIDTTAGSWHGLAAVCDNGTDVDFYGLTNNVFTSGTTAAATNIVSSSNELRIGALSGTAQEGDCAINYVQIFNRLLSSNEVRNAISSPGSVTNGLIGYWPVYGQRDPEPDLSTTGSNASVTGSGGTRGDACPAIPQQMPIM